MPKCILAYIFQRKMFSVHFPKENVQLCKNAVFFALQKTKMLCKNAFLHHILFCKNAFLHQQNVTNAFLLTFYEVKCSASHFPLENVQHHIFQRKMFSVHFPLENVQRTFSKGKCSAYIFQRKNVQQHNCSKNAFDAKMHFCNATMVP